MIPDTPYLWDDSCLIRKSKAILDDAIFRRTEVIIILVLIIVAFANIFGMWIADGKHKDCKNFEGL